ncbi:MAG: NAD(P)H-binding protein [Gemmatimonadales bacterium]
MPAPASSRDVFVTGGTGFLGSRLIRALLARKHRVRGLVREASAARLPAGAEPVVGDALHGLSYATRVAPADTLVHLVGVSHPSPAKAEEFLRVDLASVAAAVPVALTAGIRHFVYVSVAQPAPVMQAYVAARTRAESIIRESGVPCTMLRPWYVVGPGHWWPLALLPAYWMGELLPGTRASARRLGMVSVQQMVRALVHAVEQPAVGVRVLEVPQIRNSPA